MTFREQHLELVADLERRLERIRTGGGDKARERHLARGKLLVRDRVERLCDPGQPFLELSPLAAEGLYDGAAPGAGIVTGIGIVEGRTVVVVAHRYSMVAGADRVIVLETGRVTQTGTVAELSSGEGWFARFARRAARSEA